MEDEGLLLVMKSNTCVMCRDMTAGGYFDNLERNIAVKDIVIIDLGDARKLDSSVDGYEALNIDEYFPSFKYMSIQTFDSLKELSTEQALSRMCLFNGKVVGGKFVPTQDYKSVQYEDIQAFCDRSAAILRGSRAAPSRISGPSPKYRSPYASM